MEFGGPCRLWHGAPRSDASDFMHQSVTSPSSDSLPAGTFLRTQGVFSGTLPDCRVKKGIKTYTLPPSHLLHNRQMIHPEAWVLIICSFFPAQVMEGTDFCKRQTMWRDCEATVFWKLSEVDAHVQKSGQRSAGMWRPGCAFFIQDRRECTERESSKVTKSRQWKQPMVCEH